MILTDELKKDLTEISDRIRTNDNLREINCGGCGVFAALVVEKLGLDDDCIMLLDEDEYIQDRVEEDNYDSCNHVCLVFDNDIRYDGIGFLNGMLREYPYQAVANYDYLVQSLSLAHRWNSYFDRDTCIPIIEEIIEDVYASKPTRLDRFLTTLAPFISPFK